MANKRRLKHEILLVTTELVNECLFQKDLSQEKMPAEKCETLINRILDIQEEYVHRANTPEGKESKEVKNYYRKLVQDFDAAIGEVMKEIGM
ncbi:MAG: hypothetical protein LUI04_02860 [Porphyromonadaceae bacterium]|nr:hypothetical protein [Porphyromonadaceae bacterium]